MSWLWSGVSETPSLAWHVVIYNDREYIPVITTIETRPFRTFASVNRREPVRIWCEYANTRRLRPLRQSHTTSDERMSRRASGIYAPRVRADPAATLACGTQRTPLGRTCSQRTASGTFPH